MRHDNPIRDVTVIGYHRLYAAHFFLRRRSRSKRRRLHLPSLTLSMRGERQPRPLLLSRIQIASLARLR